MQSSLRSVVRLRPATCSLPPQPRLASPRNGASPWLASVVAPRTPSSSSRAFSLGAHLCRRDHEPTRVPVNATQGTPIGKVADRRLRIVFTCTAPVAPKTTATTTDEQAGVCGHRSSHEFSRQSYEKGVVIVQCPECQNRHLIADHLHWFSQTPSPAHPTGQALGSEQPRTIEQLMREKGESVRWATPGHPDGNGGGGAGEAGGQQQIKMVMRERTEQDGGKTVEVVPAEPDPSASSSQA